MADSDHDHVRTARLLELHLRLLRGYCGAREQLVCELWPLVCRHLGRWRTRVAADSIVDAATDAVMRYLGRPEAFDVSREVPLDVYVSGIATRILRIQFRALRRQRALHDAVLVASLRWTHGYETDAVSCIAIEEVREALPLVCDSRDLLAMLAWLDGADDSVVAARLGVSDVPAGEQRLVRTRLLARVIKRLQRHFRVPPPIAPRRKSLNG